MPAYIDIHTHRVTDQRECICIYNACRDFDKVLPDQTLCSIGLHPWYLDNYEKELQIIDNHASNKYVAAIGECGLDKVCKTDWGVQQQVFISQIAVANRVRKPLIIHCVRAFDELLKIFKAHPPLVPVIIHGFNKNAEVAHKLLQAGYYLSFGRALCNGNDALHTIFKNIPGYRFFLETDDGYVPIQEIYQKAAIIKETTEEAIILQVQKNFNTVFGL